MVKVAPGKICLLHINIKVETIPEYVKKEPVCPDGQFPGIYHFNKFLVLKSVF